MDPFESCEPELLFVHVEVIRVSLGDRHDALIVSLDYISRLIVWIVSVTRRQRRRVTLLDGSAELLTLEFQRVDSAELILRLIDLFVDEVRKITSRLFFLISKLI